MKKINTLLRERIGMSQEEKIEFDNLHTLLPQLAKELPFENLCIIENRTSELTEENLAHKFFTRNEGGVCYELNSLLYLFLVENNFDVKLVRGVIYENENNKWNDIGKTHVAILITYKEKIYLIDTGFGGNLPLKPVPLTGEEVHSSNGDFRVRNIKTEHGNYIFEMKVRNKDSDWKWGYAFDALESIGEIGELNEVQDIIVNHPQSPFNKKPLITRLTHDGNVTATEQSFTEWKDGKLTKREMNREEFEKLIQNYFGFKKV